MDEQQLAAVAERSARAAARGSELKERIEEIENRLDKLRRGEAVTPRDAEVSADAADRQQAHAAAAHEQAADMHLDAARVMSEAGDQAGAQRHREAAANDDAEAREDKEGQGP